MSTEKFRSYRREYMRKIRQDPAVRERQNAAVKRYRERNLEALREKSRKHAYKRLYGITEEERDRLVREQGGVCKACGIVPNTVKPWHIDHCHKTKMIRGVLCLSCNTALGHAKDDPVILRRLADYIEGINL